MSRSIHHEREPIVELQDAKAHSVGVEISHRLHPEVPSEGALLGVAVFRYEMSEGAELVHQNGVEIPLPAPRVWRCRI